VEIVEMNDEELYVPDDVLEETEKKNWKHLRVNEN
jgi:hypothetical protein